MGGNRISAVTFCYNEERVMEECINALRPYVDEIVIADLESTDRTREIAEECGVDKIFLKPWLICGDEYKMFLREQTTGDWLLWFYPDEIFPERTGRALRIIVDDEEYNSFAFMRQEFMDGVQLCVAPGVPHGTPESPNYQNRLHKKCDEIFYTGLVHAEIHGKFRTCPLPSDLFMMHKKTSEAQEFDNQRLYVWYHYSIWLYGDTKVEPYREFVTSYRKIVHDSEEKNLSGEREISLAEEFWWDWQKYSNLGRITRGVFKETCGIAYPEFLEMRNNGERHTFMLQSTVVDRAIREMEK